MTITIRPSDMIQTFIWDKYQHFCLDDKSEFVIVSNDINNSFIFYDNFKLKFD